MIRNYDCKIDLLSSLDWQRSNAEIVKRFVINEQKWMDNKPL